MKILFMMSGLNRGGMERQISQLAPALVERGHEVTIAVSYGGGYYERSLMGAGVEVVPLYDHGPRDDDSPLRMSLHVLKRIVMNARLALRSKYDIVYGFGLTANLYAVLVKPFSRSRVIWGVRNTRNPRIGATVPIERFFSRWVDIVVSNSEAGRALYESRRIVRPRLVVIPNGIDPERNRPEPSWRQEVRSRHGIGQSTIVVGIVGRLDRDKDHETFLRAAQVILRRESTVRFLVVGSGKPGWEEYLLQLSRELGIEESLIWAGSRGDVERYLNAIDIFVSCSRTEGFPNVIAEAMAIGLPCVVTTAGDSKAIVGDLGFTFNFGDHNQLASHVMRISKELSHVDHESIRRRIIDSYSVEAMVLATEQELASTLK